MEKGEEVLAEPCKFWFRPASLLHSSLGRSGSFGKKTGQKQLKEKAKQHSSLFPPAAGPIKLD